MVLEVVVHFVVQKHGTFHLIVDADCHIALAWVGPVPVAAWLVVVSHRGFYDLQSTDESDEAEDDEQCEETGEGDE